MKSIGALLVPIIIGGGCARGPSRPALQPVSLPDLSRVDAHVQAQAQERYATLKGKISSAGTPLPELAAAYGALGMILDAAEYYDVAEPCYVNAQALAPEDVHWPYYLGHLHRNRGQLDKAEAAFKRALELRHDEVGALVWLGRLYLDENRSDEAETLFTRALARAPRAVAVLAGLGRAALAKRDFARAARHLEEALTIDPEAESLHAPLAMAYRALGELDKTEPHLRQWRNRDILVPDPLKEELDLELQSGLSYELRGVRALEAHEWDTAAGLFRKGLELTPSNTGLRRSLQHKLGTALYMAKDVRGAEEQFEEVVRLTPAAGVDESTAKAYYSLGVILASKGLDTQAIDRLAAAVKYQPSYTEAHLALADALRRTGQVKASLAHYKEAVQINPRSVPGRVGYAMTLVRLRRYMDARDWLGDALARQPDQPDFAQAQARILAAAPDDRVRDGRRAMALVQELFKGVKTTALGETMAMAFAELGDYEQAAAVQRGVMAAAREAGQTETARRMAENLRLYERRRPCRTPWRDDDPVYRPGPAAEPR